MIVCHRCGARCQFSPPFQCIRGCPPLPQFATVSLAERQPVTLEQRRAGYRARNLAAGRCELCPRPAVTARHCREHADQVNERGRRYRRRRKFSGAARAAAVAIAIVLAGCADGDDLREEIAVEAIALHQRDNDIQNQVEAILEAGEEACIWRRVPHENGGFALQQMPGACHIPQPRQKTAEGG